MKFFVKLLLKAGVTLGVLFIAYRFLLPGMGGFQMPGFPEKGVKGMGEIGEPLVEKDITVYQWKDKDGVTHFGGTPPTGQGTYEKKEILANTNVMQALTSQEEEEEETSSQKVTRVGSPYSADGVKKLMDDAKGLQDQMNERKTATDELLNNL